MTIEDNLLDERTREAQYAHKLNLTLIVLIC